MAFESNFVEPSGAKVKLCFPWQQLWKFNVQSRASKAGRPSLEASLQSQVLSKWRLKATWRALGGPLGRHLEATWKPFCALLELKLALEATRSAPRAPKLSPRGAQEAPNRAQERSRGGQERPTWAQEAGKSAQVGPKRRPRAPKLGPRGGQERPS